MTDISTQSASAHEKNPLSTESEKQGAHVRLRQPNVGGSLLMVFLFLFVQLLVGLAVGIIFGLYFDISLEEHRLFVWTLLASDLLIFLLLYSGLRSEGGVSPYAIGIRTPEVPIKQCLILGGLLLAAILIFDALYVWYLGRELQQDFGEIFSALIAGGELGALVVWIMALVVGAPIIEELIFRGYLQTALVNKFGPVAGVGLASFIFALIHFDIEALPVLFVAGLGFGYLYHRTQSLWPSMLLHFAMNSWASIYYVFFT